ncbi:hypothetical protein [Pseudokineococcus marinus]|uniref:Uncharacterized protein n=1 Tax=Pseudokineococcus marinus TaxID=351215 RepID=A0A849BL18_9ACTN|nr:hypothetical protein [Pseudokineococcus marinus]NNH21777.1 hypothetical protein [Pseudokineococcus marinus]
MRGVGLGGARGEWADYEWFRLDDLPAAPEPRRPERRRPVASEPVGEPVLPVAAAEPDPLGDAVGAWLDQDPLWGEGEGAKVLLADLDNLRAGPVRWRARMSVVVRLARQADVVGISGQHGAAGRAAPHLAEWAGAVRAVDDGSDLADHELLAVAADVPASAEPLRVVVMSNDGIFADLAERGRLVVASPGADALSERLDGAAADVVDLAALEGALSRQLADRLPGPLAEQLAAALAADDVAPVA